MPAASAFTGAQAATAPPPLAACRKAGISRSIETTSTLVWTTSELILRLEGRPSCTPSVDAPLGSPASSSGSAGDLLPRSASGRREPLAIDRLLTAYDMPSSAARRLHPPTSADPDAT